MIKNTKPLHPGIVLREAYMTELSLNQTQLSQKLGQVYFSGIAVPKS